MIEDEMVGWHHQCNGHELGPTLGDGDGGMPQTLIPPYVVHW